MVRIFNILKESYAHLHLFIYYYIYSTFWLLHLFIYYYIYSLKITVKKSNIMKYYNLKTFFALIYLK